MVQYLGGYKKGIAIDLRKKGNSYSEIANSIHVPKSTVAYWVRKVKVDPEHIKKLKERRTNAARKNSAKRILKINKEIEEIKNSSAKDIDKISKRELWLMGIILYWRERLLSGHENDLRHGVRFSSSDPYLINFFLKWLQDVGGIKNEEIYFDIFLTKDKRHSIQAVKDAILYWSKKTNFPRDYFLKHIYFQRNRLKLTEVIKGKNEKILSKQSNKDHKAKIKKYKISQFGFLRIRVRASSMLARQISGWIRGIRKYYWGIEIATL